MRRNLTPHGAVELWIDGLPEAIKNRGDDEGRDNDRIEPRRAAQDVILETVLPGLGDPGYDKAREDEED